MTDTNQNSPINLLILRRILSANQPRHVYARIIYSNLDEEGAGPIGFVVASGKYSVTKQERIPKPMGDALLHNKKLPELDNILKL